MATATRKITLNASRDIPFNKLVLSQSNVRQVKAGVSIEQLAEDIAHRSLLDEGMTQGKLRLDLVAVSPANSLTCRPDDPRHARVCPCARAIRAACGVTVSSGP